MIGETNECPAYHTDSRTAKQFVRVYAAYKSGHLPIAGGVLDQPLNWMDALEFYDGLA